MDILQEFLTSCGLGNMTSLEFDDIVSHTDASEFNVIDNEEADYGIIKYYDKDNNLLATKTVFGGDDEEIEFTDLSRKILSEMAFKILHANINYFC